MTREEELNQWKSRIKLAIDIRRPYLSDWNYWEQVYDNNLWGKNKFGNRRPASSPNSPVQINEIDPIINNIIPKINFNYPVFDVEDMVSGNSLASLIYEVYAMKLFEILDMFFVIRDILLDTLLFGGGVHKTGMSYDVESQKYNLEDTTATKSIMNEMVMSESVSPKNILWDYRFGDWNNKRWIAEEIVKPLDEIKDSSLYDNTSKLKANLSSSDELPLEIRKDYTNKDQDLIKIIEIHDLTSGKIITISNTHNQFLQYADDYGFELYDQLVFTPTRPKRFWGKSLVQDIEQHLVRLSLANHWMDEDSKSVAKKNFMVDNSIGKNAIQVLESDKPRAIVPIDGLMGMANDPIREVRVVPNTFQWNTVMGIVERQIRGLTGSTAQERGTHEAGVETAVEANMLMEASEIRNKDRALLTSVFIQKIMTKMLRISSDFIRPERIAELIGIPQQDSYMIEPFDTMKLTVRFGSTAIEARQIYMQKLVQIAQLFPDMVNRQALMQKFMTALGFGLKDQDLLINQQPIPQEQQVQQKVASPQQGQGSPF